MESDKENSSSGISTTGRIGHHHHHHGIGHHHHHGIRHHHHHGIHHHPHHGYIVGEYIARHHHLRLHPRHHHHLRNIHYHQGRPVRFHYTFGFHGANGGCRLWPFYVQREYVEINIPQTTTTTIQPGEPTPQPHPDVQPGGPTPQPHPDVQPGGPTPQPHPDVQLGGPTPPAYPGEQPLPGAVTIDQPQTTQPPPVGFSEPPPGGYPQPPPSGYPQPPPGGVAPDTPQAQPGLVSSELPLDLIDAVPEVKETGQVEEVCCVIL